MHDTITEPPAESRRTSRPPHADDIDGLVAGLGTDPTTGLSSAEVEERLARIGPNRLSEPPRKSTILRLAAQFASPLVLTLIGAAVIATFVGLSHRQDGGFLTKFGDALAILLIVVINAVLGFVQERRAEAAMLALKSMTAPTARVRRNGALAEIQADDLVPGDILEMEAGDFVPADARLVATVDFATEEAALTGESEGTEKDARQPLADDAPLAERRTMVFLGTTVLRGRGRAVVVATGPRTELGKIGEMISHAENERTPLEQRLDRFGHRVLLACLATSAVLFGWGIMRGGRAWHDLLLEAVSFAVAAIPEGLPAITTITLALGMQRMAKRGAIVRKLLAVETLGAASIICTDKTGTLTRNEMTVRLVYAARTRYGVTGEGYAPEGKLVTEQGEALDALPSTLDHLLSTAALCTNARLDRDPATKAWKVIGDPTEGALLTLAAKGGRDKESVSVKHTVVRELPFDSDRKRMTVITLDREGREVAHVKGGVDVLLPLCVKIATDEGVRSMTPEDRAIAQEEAERMSAEALRVLAIARRERPSDNPEDALTFLGLVAMKDPPRSGVKEAIHECAEAGVRTVMITGDHPLTAVAIARELGLWAPDDKAITGVELARMPDDELRRRAMQLRVFARTTAEQKLRIVNAFRALGHVVAMTGDGVNDAPALKRAHIGVAMGRSGTDVARQAADLVLSDDNFVTILDAVREGRSIYRNIQKFIFFLLSSNAGLAVAVFVVSFIPGALPPTPLQILWINLVTNGLPALALGIDPADPGHMKEKPRAASAGLLGARDFVGVGFVGLVMGLCAAGLYVFGPTRPGGVVGFERAMAFSLLALSPLFHAFSCRSPLASIFRQTPLVSLPLLGACLVSAGVHLLAVLVPGLRPVFRTFPMDEGEWLLVLGLSFAIVPAVEIVKWFGRMRRAWLKLAVLAFLLSARWARADGIAIRPDMLAPGAIKMDGVPREWPSAMTELSKTVSGSAGSEIGMRGTFAYDETNLYVAAEFKDNRLVRVSCSDLEDHAALLLAFPTPRGAYTLHEVGLFPGDPGKAPGCVRRKGGASVPGARIVEAPKGLPGRYSFEASIPWSAFPEAARTRVGLRAALRYYDADGRTIRAVLGTSTEVPPADLPRFAIDAEQSLEDGLLREKRITSPPFRDRVADVSGDGMLERVAVYDRYMVILGPHFRGGKEYYFADLGVDVSAGQMPMFEVRDVNGDGKAEIVMRQRVGSADQWRERLVVMAMGKAEAMSVLFQHETGIHGAGGTVNDDVRFGAEGGKPSIEIAAGAATGYSAATYREPVETAVEPLLLPWGPIRAQTFQWNGREFAKVHEEKRASGASLSAGIAAPVPLAAAVEPRVPDARPPSTDELQDRVYALYRRDRRVPAGEKARFDLAADVAEDARKERMLLQGRDLVVFGKGFRGGTGYAYITLDQFADAADVTDVTARDMTGDGKAEIVVRGVFRAEAPRGMKELHGAVVERDVLLVYAMTPQGIARVFGAETGRAVGTRRITGALMFIPSGRGMDIELRPGRAVGFTEKSYPFGQDRTASGGLEPLLLPWGGEPPARYHWNGAAFVR